MAATLNLAGGKFGLLTALYPVKHKDRRAWHCACECGEFTTVVTHNLTGGRVESCGCKRYPLLTGRTFGKLSVLGLAEPRKGRRFYRVRCECGRESEVESSKLTGGYTKSCGRHSKGIPQPSKRKPLGVASFNYVVATYKRNAKIKGLAFDLAQEDIRNLLIADCHYCGAPPSKIAHQKGTYGEFVYNGIDRLDNLAGYIAGNVVSCCAFCNYKKGATHHDEFVNWIKRVAARF